MTQAKRDENRVTVGLGVSNVDGTTLPLQIDSVTGRLLMDVISVTDAGGTASGPVAVRDENHVPACLARASDDSANLSPAIDNRSGRLYLDLIFT